MNCKLCASICVFLSSLVLCCPRELCADREANFCARLWRRVCARTGPPIVKKTLFLQQFLKKHTFTALWHAGICGTQLAVREKGSPVEDVASRVWVCIAHAVRLRSGSDVKAGQCSRQAVGKQSPVDLYVQKLSYKLSPGTLAVFGGRLECRQHTCML